ncbi:MAG: serine/threonine-protein kinase [Verrucomicrobiota bacterium]
MNETPNRQVAIFTEALQLPPSKRAAYLEIACGGDHVLRQKVEVLLAGHDQAGDFLEQSPRKTGFESKLEGAASEKPGDRIGRYKLLQQIGEGGCGVVFMAEQEEPVLRRVALKIIKPGMDTKSVIARFDVERQALALMNHPNIAKILDAGATESGRPYFVMELVRGVKITEYCDKHSLSTGERLKLFVQVCQAIQHAHQKGVIHRDIKPSNILVTATMEGTALPVVIDFGIAKATTNQRLTNKTLFTAFEMLIGTPAYMSPEQAELTSMDVDTRTDIYSLGVLLYELLTSSTPFDTGDLLKSGIDEIRRVIREQDPPRPSTRLSRMTGADLTSIALHHKSEPPTLIHAVRGDLDWIAMKALEKDRRRRYETASGMALDVQRYLSNEPISARPPSTLYKFKKLVSRNKLLFMCISVIALLLVVSLIVVSAALARERGARREAVDSLRQAETEKGEAQIEAAKSKQVTQFLEDMLNGVGPGVARGQDTKMLTDILNRTAERVGLEMTNQPEVEAELRSLIGGLYEQIGNYDQAERMHRAALAINRRLYGEENAATAKSLNDLGLALIAGEKWSEAEAEDSEALAIRRRLFGNDNADTATSLNDLSTVYRQEGKLKEAEAMAREALKVRQEKFPDESLEVADSLRNLSIILGDERNWAGSEKLAREVLAIRIKLLGPDHPWVASSLDDIAWAAGGGGNLQEAGQLQLQALALRRKTLPDEHRDVANSLHLIGDTLREQGKTDEAFYVLSAVLSIQRKLLDEDDPALIGTIHSIGLTLADEGKLTDAESVIREALALRRTHGGNEDPQTLSELETLAKVLESEKKFVEAQKLLTENLTPAFVKQPASAGLLELRADFEAKEGQWREASADAAIAYEHQPADHTYFPVLAALLVQAHNSSAYERFCKQLLTTFGDTTDIYVADQVAKSCLFIPAPGVDLNVVSRLSDMTVTEGAGDLPAMPYFEDCKALCEYRQGHYAESIEWIQKSLQFPGLSVRGQACAILAMADWWMGRRDEARAMLAKGETFAPEVMPESIALDPGTAWVAWLYSRIQLDEATELIQPASTIDHNPHQP